jgi:hypothetical protein
MPIKLFKSNADTEVIDCFSNDEDEPEPPRPSASRVQAPSQADEIVCISSDDSDGPWLKLTIMIMNKAFLTFWLPRLTPDNPMTVVGKKLTSLIKRNDGFLFQLDLQ